MEDKWIKWNRYWAKGRTWDKVFKNGPSKICGRQSLKKVKRYGLLSRYIPFKIFKGCLPQMLLGPFLSTLSHISIDRNYPSRHRTLFQRLYVYETSIRHQRRPIDVLQTLERLKQCLLGQCLLPMK